MSLEPDSPQPAEEDRSGEVRMERIAGDYVVLCGHGGGCSGHLPGRRTAQPREVQKAH